MRGARWLLLLAISAILGWLGFTYRIQRRSVEQQAPAKPEMLPADVSATSRDYQIVKKDEKGRKIVEIWAKNFKQDKDSSQIELEGVRLHLFHGDGDKFHLVESPSATYKPGDDKLHAEGEVTITLAVPAEGEPSNRLVSIHTSGVTFDSKTAKASTDRPADFTFQNGTGKCVGAIYDPATKELMMLSNVELNLQGRGPNGQPMKLESGQLVYKEQESYILLYPWVKLKRDKSTIEGGDTVVTLKKGVIERIEAQKATGTELDPKRPVSYSADRLTVNYSEHGDIEKVIAEPNARIVSETDLSKTTVTTDRMDLEFFSHEHQSALKTALAHGHGVFESKPLAPPDGQPLPDTRILRSEVIELKMRPDGREIEEVNTQAPGQIEFVPNHASSRRRRIDGERINIAYGPRNVIQSFTALKAQTRTDAKTPKGAPLETWSDHMSAEFDPKTGQMVKMRQWDNFRYVESERKAVASQATLEQGANMITLETAARVWDPTGSTSADTIHLDQSTGNFNADGHVSSSRVQDKKTPSSGMLSGGEPIQATAQRMTSTNSNKLIRYEGKADMWQGPNRIRADRIEIDREAGRLVATGAVQTQLLEKEKAATASKAGAPPIFTNVKSTALVYTETDRLAYYTGGVTLTRPELLVKSLELRSYLSEAGADNSLEKAFADGKVEIVQTSPLRKRTGNSEHAEYYVSDQKILLRGGAPILNDSVKGVTRGSELTYYAGDDRLMVNGAPEQPAKSRIRRK
jgi:lipopolysaccharide export system protein LptA